MIYARKTVFSVDRTVPAIIIEPVQQGDTLIYDSNTGSFTDVPMSEALPVVNTGTGARILDITNNTLTVKGLTAGSNISIVDDGSTITISDKSTYLVDTIADLSALTPANGATAFVADIGTGIPALFVYDGAWIISNPNVNSQMLLSHTTIAYSQSSPITLITLPSQAVITSLEVSVMIPFNGSSPSLTIGTSATPDLLMDANSVDISQAGTFINEANSILPSGTQVINAYFNNTDATQGTIIIFISYLLM